MTDGTAHVEGVVSAAEQAGGLLAGAVREEGLADLCGDEQRYLLSCKLHRILSALAILAGGLDL